MTSGNTVYEWPNRPSSPSESPWSDVKMITLRSNSVLAFRHFGSERVGDVNILRQGVREDRPRVGLAGVEFVGQLAERATEIVVLDRNALVQLGQQRHRPFDHPLGNRIHAHDATITG